MSRSFHIFLRAQVISLCSSNSAKPTSVVLEVTAFEPLDIPYQFFFLPSAVFLQDQNFWGSLMTPCLKIRGLLANLEGQNFINV